MFFFFFFYKCVGGEDIIANRLKTVSKFASSETVEYNRKEDIVEIFLLRIWGTDSFDSWGVQF